MKLYYHQTSGGAEYYSTDFIICPNGEKEGTCGKSTVMRTDGNEIELFSRKIFNQGFTIAIDGVQITPEVIEKLKQF